MHLRHATLQSRCEIFRRTMLLLTKEFKAILIENFKTKQIFSEPTFDVLKCRNLRLSSSPNSYAATVSKLNHYLIKFTQCDFLSAQAQLKPKVFILLIHNENIFLTRCLHSPDCLRLINHRALNPRTILFETISSAWRAKINKIK